MVAGQVARRAARSGALWGLIFGLYILVQTHAYTSAYKTQAARDQLAQAYGTNIGLNALLGSERAINTVAGYAEWRLLGILSVLGSIWGLLTSTRLMRGEEEAGRYDLLLAGQTTRRRAGGQAMAGLGVGLLALFVLTALGTVVTGRAPSVGFSLGQCLSFSVTLVAGAAMFLAIGALTSQLAGTRRRAASMAGVVFGIAYALRMVADTNPGLHWLVWLSPLGWIEESRPLTDPNPMALLPVLILLIAVTAVTLHLAGTRDLGAATLPGRDSSSRIWPARRPLGPGPAADAAGGARLAVRGGGLRGAHRNDRRVRHQGRHRHKDRAGDRTPRRARLTVADYLGLTFLILALLVALVAAGQITAIRTEEADGHLENLVVRP